MEKFIANGSMSVSAVIPVYNAAAYIRETITSLLQQETPLTEIIVVDDASTDESCLIVEQFTRLDARVMLYKFDSNQGVSAARNFGYQAAAGEWVLFVDGDDIADPQLLKKQLRRASELAENPDYGQVLLIHSAYQQIDEVGNRISGVTRWRQVLPPETFGYFLLRNHIITASGVLVRKEALKRTGGFNPELRYAEDWDLWLRLAQLGGFGYVDEPLLYVRRHKHNTSKTVTTGLKGERQVLRQYSTNVIRDAIFLRNLPWEINAADYAAMLFRLDMWDVGCEIVNTILRNSPAFATGYFWMGVYYLKQRNWKSACQYFEQTLVYDDLHGAALNNLGALLAAAGEVNIAIKYLNRALELFPGYLDARRNLKLLEDKTSWPGYEELHFTSRELRPVLLSYSE